MQLSGTIRLTTRHVGMFQEVQATVASKGVVVRTRGTNPINKGILIYDRNAIRIVTAGESLSNLLMFLLPYLH